MVGGGVRDNRGIRLERGERLVAFIHFRHGKLARALPHGTDARTVHIPAHDLCAVHDGRVEPTFHEDMCEDGGDGGLPARAGHGYELTAGQHLGKRGGAVDHGDAALLRLAKARIRILNRGGDDDTRRRGVHAAPVVWEKRHALRCKRAQHRRGRRRADGRDLTVGTGHGNSPIKERLREGTHAHAADANQMCHVRHVANLNFLTCPARVRPSSLLSCRRSRN